MEQLKALGKEHGLKNAALILDGVRKAIARWREHASYAGVSAKSVKTIEAGISRA